MTKQTAAAQETPAETAAPEKPHAEKPRLVRLLERDLHLAEQRRVVHLVTPPETVSLDEMLRPDFWTHVARKLREGDHIEVQPLGRAFYAELLVLGRSDFDASVAVLRHVDLQSRERPRLSEEDFEIKLVNGRYVVCRKSDGTRLDPKGHEALADAAHWLRSYLRKLGA